MMTIIIANMKKFVSLFSSYEQRYSDPTKAIKMAQGKDFSTALFDINSFIFVVTSTFLQKLMTPRRCLNFFR